MKLHCPKCGSDFPTDQINVQRDAAFCGRCNEAFRISGLLDEADLSDLENPPDGTWYERGVNRVVIGASTRSPAAFILVPFFALWSGGSLWSIYGTQITSGRFDPFTSLFGLPFVAGTLLLGSLTLMHVAGRIEITLGDESEIFAGVGSIGWRRRFDWSEVDSVYEEHSRGNGIPFTSPSSIAIKADETLRLHPSLREERHEFVLKALKRELMNRTRKGLLS